MATITLSVRHFHMLKLQLKLLISVHCAWKTNSVAVSWNSHFKWLNPHWLSSMLFLRSSVYYFISVRFNSVPTIVPCTAYRISAAEKKTLCSTLQYYLIHLAEMSMPTVKSLLSLFSVWNFFAGILWTAALCLFLLFSTIIQ